MNILEQFDFQHKVQYYDGASVITDNLYGQ